MAAERPQRTEAADSFIHAARRAQLIDAAIEVIAQVGLDQASTVRIAQRAGVSRGVVAYHFRDRAALLDGILAKVYELGRVEVGPAVAAAANARDALQAFVGGSIDFYAAHPRDMAALTEIFIAARRRDGLPLHVRETDDVSAALRAGQEQGRFRAFDVGVMATTIRSILDSAVHRICVGEPVEPLRSELLTTIDLMTKAD